MLTSRQTLSLVVTLSISAAVGLSCGSVRARNPNSSQNLSVSNKSLSANPNPSIPSGRATDQELLSRQSLVLSSSQVNANRIFVRFNNGGGVTRGSTSVAVRTQ
jgi:hypothetical protein